MGYILQRLVNDQETLNDRKIGVLTGGIYMRAISMNITSKGGGSTPMTEIMVAYYEDKTARDQNELVQVRPAFKQETKTVVESVDDVINTNFQIALDEARQIEGYENANVGDVINMPDNMQGIVLLPTTFTLAKDGQSFAALYADNDFRNVFTALGMTITDVDPDS